jgi:hypothetical protein
MGALLLRAVPGGTTLKVRAAPGSKVERIAGVHGDALKIAVQAPAEKGRANARVLELLAAALAIPVRALHVAAGPASRDKVVHVAGLTPDEVRARLHAHA